MAAGTRKNAGCPVCPAQSKASVFIQCLTLVERVLVQAIGDDQHKVLDVGLHRSPAKKKKKCTPFGVVGSWGPSLPVVRPTDTPRGNAMSLIQW